MEAGPIDVPWSPSHFNAGKALPGRDRFGAVRYLAHGRIPLPPEVLKHHRAKLADRSGGDTPGMLSERLLADLTAVSRPVSGNFGPDGWRDFGEYARLLGR